LAGFASVAVMLGRGPGRWSAGDALRIRFILTAAFTALFASLLATGSEWAGANEAASIRLGAAAVLVGQAYWVFILGQRELRALEPTERALFDPRLAVFFRVVVYSSGVGQLVVVSGFAGRASAPLLLYGLLSCLGYTAIGFIRLLFIRPSSQ